MTVHLKLILHIPMKQDLNYRDYLDGNISAMSAVEVRIIDLDYDLPTLHGIRQLEIRPTVIKAMREAILKAYPDFVGLANHKELNNLLDN